MSRHSMIFISYSWGDFPTVRAFNQRLVDAGYRTWIDFENLDLSAPLEPQVQEAVRLAKLVLCVDSPHSRSSSWVRREVSWAARAGVLVIGRPISSIGD